MRSTGASTATSGAARQSTCATCSRPTGTSQSRDSRGCVALSPPHTTTINYWKQQRADGCEQALITETENLLEKWKHPDPYRPPTAPGGTQLHTYIPRIHIRPHGRGPGNANMCVLQAPSTSATCLSRSWIVSPSSSCNMTNGALLIGSRSSTEMDEPVSGWGRYDWGRENGICNFGGVYITL